MSSKDERDGGFSLIELLISMAIFGLLMALIMGALIMSMNQAKDDIARADTADQMGMAIAQLDSQIRSGSVIADPSAELLSASGVREGYSVRILTQRGGVDTCAQWRVVFGAEATGALQFRSWPAWVPTGVTDWVQVADGVVPPRSPFVAGDASTFEPFSMDSTSGDDAVIKSLRITLRVRADGTDSRGKPSLVTTTVTGRNTIFGSSGLECSNVPAP